MQATPTPGELKNQFNDYISEKSKSNILSELSEGEFRLATYNIHYFTNSDESASTYNGILEDIGKINASVIGIEEYILGNEVKINDTVSVDTMHFYRDIIQKNYKKSITCNSVPSWFKSIYGNIALVHNRICDDTKCLKLKETIHTFDKSTHTAIVSGSHSGTAETRCFIYISIEYNNFNIHIYVTHLDVASEDLRAEQIEYIFKDSAKFNNSNDVVFVMGDFNTFYPEDLDNFEKRRAIPDGNLLKNWKNIGFLRENGKVAEKIKEYNFFDCHANNAEIMTTWNTTRVDFILCNKEIVSGFRAEYFYTLNSDHIPVVLTLESKLTFSDTWKSAKKHAKKGGKYKRNGDKTKSKGKHRQNRGKSKRRRSKRIV